MQGFHPGETTVGLTKSTITTSLALQLPKTLATAMNKLPSHANPFCSITFLATSNNPPQPLPIAQWQNTAQEHHHKKQMCQNHQHYKSSGCWQQCCIIEC
jgi:hypothetical protein